MITGVVTARREATIRLIVRGTSGQEQEVEAVIDTGFNGWFSLPPAIIAALQLPWLTQGRGLLADGSLTVFDIYQVTVIWDGQPRNIPVEAANTDPLVGMSLLYGYDLRIQALDAGIVTIEKLP